MSLFLKLWPLTRPTDEGSGNLPSRHMTSKQRIYVNVTSTSLRRQYDVMCPLGRPELHSAAAHLRSVYDDGYIPVLIHVFIYWIKKLGVKIILCNF